MTIRQKRFEVHFENCEIGLMQMLRFRFEAQLETISLDETDAVRWRDCDLRPPILKQASALYQRGLSVREVAAILRISKTEAGRLRLRALSEGSLSARHGGDRLVTNGHNRASWSAAGRFSPIQR
jgi:hypothetical protein